MSLIALVDVAEMAVDLKEVARLLGEAASEVARRWAAQRVSSVQRYGEILATYGTGRSSSRAAAEDVARLAAEEAARYPSEAFQFWSDCLTAVARTAGISLGSSNIATASNVRPVLDIDLNGKLGSVATRDFILENPHASEAMIGFAAAKFVGGDREVLAAPVFDPKEFTLPGNTERKVMVSVRLDPRKFRKRQSYSARVIVSGIDDMILRVHLTVSDPE
jgi:hypothetical protein